MKMSNLNTSTSILSVVQMHFSSSFLVGGSMDWFECRHAKKFDRLILAPDITKELPHMGQNNGNKRSKCMCDGSRRQRNQ